MPEGVQSSAPQSSAAVEAAIVGDETVPAAYSGLPYWSRVGRAKAWLAGLPVAVPAPPPPVVLAPLEPVVEAELLAAALLELLDDEREPTTPPTTAPAMMSSRSGTPIQSHFFLPLLVLLAPRPDPSEGLASGG